MIATIILICPRGTFDLQLHDTYFVITSSQAAVASCLFLGFMGLVYWAAKDYSFIKWLTILTVVSTLFSITGLILLSIFQLKIAQSSFHLHGTIQQTGWSLLVIFIISQFLTVVNFGIAIVRGKDESGS